MGAMEAMGDWGGFFLIIIFSCFLSPVIWQPDTVVFGDCLRRPPPGGAPRHPPPRL